MTVLSDNTIKQLCQQPYDVLDYKTIRYNKDNGIYVPKDRQYMPKQFTNKNQPMISPFVGESVRKDDNGNGIVSYGLSSFGYDVRLGDKFSIFTDVHNAMIDPLAPDPDCFVHHQGDYCIIPPNSYILGHTIETFRIPRNVMVVALGKSTYARLGCIINVTPIEPEFEGQVVIEIANSSRCPAKVYANQGIAQFMFLEGNMDCNISYADRGGKYQNQRGVVPARV